MMLTHIFSRLFALVTASALILAVLQPQTAYACSCFWDPDLTDEQRMEQNLSYSDVAFVGRADTVTLFDEQNNINSAYYHATFSVDEVYEGDVPQEFTIGSHASGATCGYQFEEGLTYLVFVNYDENGRYGGIEWTTHLCAGNEREPAADLISVMGDVSAQVNIPTAVTTQESETESNPANWLWIIPVFLGSGVAIFASRKKGEKESDQA